MATPAALLASISARGGVFARSGQAWDYEGRAYASGAMRLVPMRGVLIEGARTLLTPLLGSWSSFTNLSRTVDCPYGAFTVYDLTPNTTSGLHSASSATWAYTTQDYCLRAIGGAKGYDKLFMRTTGLGSDAGRQFDLDAYTDLAYSGLVTPAAYGVRELWGGWADCWLGVSASGTGSMGMQLLPNSSTTYAGNGTNRIGCWHASAETGRYPTSPMLSSRSAETLVFTLGSADYSTGTIAMGFWVDHVAAGAPERTIWRGFNNASGQGYRLYITDPNGRQVVLSTPAGDIQLGQCNVGAANKAGFRFSATSANGALNGTIATQLAQSVAVTIDREHWGHHDASGSLPLNGYLRGFVSSATATDNEVITRTV